MLFVLLWLLLVLKGVIMSRKPIICHECEICGSTIENWDSCQGLNSVTCSFCSKEYNYVISASQWKIAQQHFSVNLEL